MRGVPSNHSSASSLHQRNAAHQRAADERDAGVIAPPPTDDDAIDRIVEQPANINAAENEKDTAGLPVPGPLKKPKNPRSTDFRELHMMGPIMQGLGQNFATRHSWSALLQIIGRGVFPGVAAAALSRVVLGAQIVDGAIQFNANTGGPDFTAGLVALGLAGVGASFKKEERKWDVNGVRFVTGGPEPTPEEKANLKKALDKLVDMTDSSLQSVSALVGVYVAFDKCAVGYGPLVSTLVATGLAISLAGVSNIAVNAKCWDNGPKGERSINVTLRDRRGLPTPADSADVARQKDKAVKAQRQEASERIDEEIEDSWPSYTGMLARLISAGGTGAAIGTAWFHQKPELDAARLVILNMIPGATASALLTNGICDFTEKLREAPKPFLFVKGDWARANPTRLDDNLTSNDSHAWPPSKWKGAQWGVVALAVGATLCAMGGTVPVFYHGCDVAATSDKAASSNAATTTDFVTHTANVTVPTTLTATATANASTVTVPETVTITVNHTDTETLTASQSPLTLTITLPPSTDTATETATKTAMDTVTIPVTITLPPSTETDTETKNQTQTSVETVLVPVVLTSTVEAETTITDEKPVTVTLNVTVTPSEMGANASSAAGNATVNRVPTTFNTSTIPPST